VVKIRQSLEPWNSDYTLTSVQQAKETFDTAIALLRELGKSLGDTKISDYTVDLNKHKEELLAPASTIGVVRATAINVSSTAITGNGVCHNLVIQTSTRVGFK